MSSKEAVVVPVAPSVPAIIEGKEEGKEEEKKEEKKKGTAVLESL